MDLKLNKQDLSEAASGLQREIQFRGRLEFLLKAVQFASTVSDELVRAQAYLDKMKVESEKKQAEYSAAHFAQMQTGNAEAAHMTARINSLRENMAMREAKGRADEDAAQDQIHRLGKAVTDAKNESSAKIAIFEAKSREAEEKYEKATKKLQALRDAI